MQKPKVIAIVGPTASGKTALGILLAKKLQGEIISADSRQVYKGLNIGTGKVTKKEMTGVPHHLLDVISPKKQFSVDDFVKRARKAHSNILQNDRMTIVVGGTGMYVDALLGRLSYPNVPPNPKLRARLEKKSAAALFAILKTKDPARAKTIEPQNKRRLIRAIEIAEVLRISPQKATPREHAIFPADKNRSSSRADALESLPLGSFRYEILWLGINPGEETLKKNIRARLQTRLRAGMIAEARRLHAQGLSFARMRALGLEYRFLADLLQKKISREEFEAGLERAIWHYAKRQLRWFRRNKDIIWVANSRDAVRRSQAFVAPQRHTQR